ncbi:MAG TPA: hypothetical protein VH643_18695 [Gemmataceae bacterium]|jgi:hypothetical protein
MKLPSARSLAALIVVLAVAGHGRADYMNWTYTSTPSVPGVSVGAQSPGGGAAVTLTDFKNGTAGTSIPVIAYVTQTASTSPITFDPSAAKYSLGVTITDNATHDSGTLTFAGAVGGTLSATTSTLTNSFAPSTNSLTLDGHVYTVTIPTTNLAAPTSPQQNIMATVSVSNVSGGGTPPPPSPPPPSPPPPPPTTTPPPSTNTPEPSSVVLACAAISLVGLASGRRLRLRLTMA